MYEHNHHSDLLKLGMVFTWLAHRAYPEFR